jgi:hypothetical protein
MTALAAPLQDGTRTGAGRLLATWFLLLAFALQSYVTQTHLHPTAVSAHPAAAVKLAPNASAHRATPGGDEAAACPFCQAVASAGAFLTPGAAAVLPLAATSVLLAHAPDPAGRAAAPAGFAWRSRAPPRS